MALSADTYRNLVIIGAESRAYVLENAAVAYKGALMGLDRATGYAEPYNDQAGFDFIGLCDSQATTGDASATVVVHTGGCILSSVTVTGASGVTDNGDPVYATDDDTFDKSQPGSDKPIGYIQSWITSTTCDVVLYSADGWKVLNAGA